MAARRATLRLITTLAFLLPAAAGWSQQTDTGVIQQDDFDLQGRYNVVLGAGARALGMGGAFMARADDATAASWNPAGLSYLLRPELSLVGVVNQARVVSRDETDIYRGSEPDFVAVTYPLPSVAGAAQISFQRMIPFSGHRTIEREKSISTLQAQGGIDVLALGTGWKVAPSLRVGATLNHWTNGFYQELTRTRETNRNTSLSADLRFTGWNLNIGFIWTPVNGLNVAAVAKTPFSARVHLTKSRADYWYSPDGKLLTINRSNAAKDALRIDFPAAYGVGASWRIRSALTLSADYTRSAWSLARIYGFYTLKAGPAEGPNPDPEGFDELPYPLLVSDQADSAQLRMGAEYVVIRDRFKWPLRAGYILDQQLFRGGNGDAPMFGAVTVGTGIIVGPVLFDVAYLREVGSVNVADAGPTRHTTQRFFVSLIYRHAAVR